MYVVCFIINNLITNNETNYLHSHCSVTLVTSSIHLLNVCDVMLKGKLIVCCCLFFKISNCGDMLSSGEFGQSILYEIVSCCSKYSSIDSGDSVVIESDGQLKGTEKLTPDH